MSLLTGDRMQWLEGIATHAKSIPDNSALRYICHETGTEETTTYSELERRSDHAAAVLQEMVPPGSTILLCLRNGTDFPIALLAAFKAGLSVLPVSTSSTVHELRGLAETVSAALFIRHEGDVRTLGHPAVLEMDVGDLHTGSERTPGEVHGQPAVMLRTSGTTGMPKVVFRDMQSVDQVSQNVCAAMRLTPDDSVLALVPMCHSYGIEHCVLAPLHAGSEVVTVDGIDASPIHALLRDSAATVFPGFPFAYERMIEEAPRNYTHSLRLAYSAGSTLPETVSKRFFDQFGVRLGQLYGSTEVGSVLFNDPESDELSTRSVGHPLPGVQTLILDIEDPDLARPLAPGCEGQVAIISSTMLSRYVGHEMRDMLEGHFLTGDLGLKDASGAIEITGRLKHQIDIAGAKVNPLEVEAAILECEGIRECVVLPCGVRGTLKRLRAVLVAESSASPPAVADLKAHLRSRLSAYKVPRIYEFRTELPRTPLGKIIRTESAS